jgi:hypothetical protein
VGGSCRGLSNSTFSFGGLVISSALQDLEIEKIRASCPVGLLW